MRDNWEYIMKNFLKLVIFLYCKECFFWYNFKKVNCYEYYNLYFNEENEMFGIYGEKVK